MPSKTVMISLGNDRLVMLEKTETFYSRKEFSFFSVRAFKLILFAADFYANSEDFRTFSEFLKYKKYTKYTDCYRLVCCYQILFLLCWLLILMKLWIVSGGY